jgi:replicative DNA helicase Mcm
MEEKEAIAALEEFFQEKLSARIAELANVFPEKRSLEIDFKEIEKFNPDLADAILENPDELTAWTEFSLKQLNPPTPGKPFEPHARFMNLPEACDSLVQDLGATQLNKLVRVQGVVSLVSEIKPRMQHALWECIHCETRVKTFQDKGTLTPPGQCSACLRRGKELFRLLEKSSEFTNMQNARLQELVERVKGSAPAAQINLWMEDDLVNQIVPGEKVVVTGVLRLKALRTKRGGRSTVYAKFFDVNHVQKMEQEFEEIEITREEEQQILELAKNPRLSEMVVSSVAPGIYGYKEMKEAIALQLFGGTPNKVLPDGQRIRSEPHILLIGDPGCIVADERIVLGNGAIVKIGDVGERHLQPIDLRVLTGEGGRKKDVATVFHKYENQPVIEVVTESGKSVKGTLNHPLLCVRAEDGNLVREWKRLDELKVGDRLAVATAIPCEITAYVPTGFKPLQRRLGPKFKGKLPEVVSPELAALLGYLVGDGWARKYEIDFVVAEPEKDILERLLRACEKLFGLKAHKTKHALLPGRRIELYYYALTSQDVAFNLQFIREKRIPDVILRSGNEVASEFLKWLYEADGCVFDKGRGRRAIGLKAKGIELLRDTQMLLLRFHIHSRIIGNALLIRRGRDIQRFAEKIGFASEKKKKKLGGLVAHAKDFKRFRDQRSERIVEIVCHPNETVYDIEVPFSHRFIANGIISHNTGKSALLQYVERIAPKCIYVAGAGASGVGLTASAERDEFGEGWVLKAGALVLASGGCAAIDELEKMRDEDMGAIHSAMEQGIVSVAKAGMVTKFRARTAVLAAANPKFGRFDPTQPVAPQFALDPALLSRFDLIFPIKDVLDAVRDRKMAEHIIAGQRHAMGTAGDTAQEREVLSPIPIDLFRKYIAYSRRTVFPKLTREAEEKIMDYYVELRRLGEKEKTFPITARQIEGLIRLAEASAKMRLSERVETQDAERAIALMDYVLREVFVDRETGKIDYDVIATGQAKSRTDRMRSILGIISDMEKKMDLVSVSDVVKEAVTSGIEEYYARRLITELMRQGDLYEPQPGFIKSARHKAW